MASLELEVPAILNLPEKLIPLITEINNYRYFLIEGGRGGGKSQAVGRFILYLAEQKDLRIVCGRETQNSIEESVYTILSDLIRDNNLYFDILTSRIDHKKTKSSIKFRGFREQGAINIKGMEGIDVLWIDEAQAITKQTLDVIIPTIRKNNAKIFFTMNRFMHNDPVFEAFANRPDCLHIKVNYTDNPFCTEALKTEAEQCRLTDDADYRHIWLGEPLKQGDNYLFSADTVLEAHTNEFVTDGVKQRVLAVDVARFGEDETVFSIIESRGAFCWTQVHQETWRGKSTMECVGKVVDLVRTMAIDLTVIDDTGVGGGVTDRLKELYIKVMPFNGANKAKNFLYGNARSEGFFMLKDLLDNKRIRIIDDKGLKDQLLTIMYKYKSNGQKAIVSKDEMRSEGIKSPDRADALMMALYFQDFLFKTVNSRVVRNLEPEPTESLI